MPRQTVALQPLQIGTLRAVQRVNSIPVRSAPFSALPGRYGPAGPEKNVGMCSVSPCARAQNAAAEMVLPSKRTTAGAK